MVTETIAHCVLEIDSDRGVIYVHSGTTVWTLLRISGLPTPIPPRDYKPGTHQEPMLDIHCETRSQCSWHGKQPMPKGAEANYVTAFKEALAAHVLLQHWKAMPFQDRLRAQFIKDQEAEKLACVECQALAWAIRTAGGMP